LAMTHGPPGMVVNLRNRLAWSPICLLSFSSSPGKYAALVSTTISATPPKALTSFLMRASSASMPKTPGMKWTSMVSMSNFRQRHPPHTNVVGVLAREKQHAALLDPATVK
jgi:hypothetical protein